MTDNIIDRIVKVRRELKLYQKDFAEKVGTTQSNLSHLERNRSVVSETIIKGVIKEFNVNPYWLLFGEGEMFETGVFQIPDLDKQHLKNLKEENRLLKIQIDTYLKALEAIGKGKSSV